MPRARGAANQRTESIRSRGDHGAHARAGDHAARRAAHPATETTDSFQLFLNQASRYPLLTREEEVELAKRIERGDLEAKERLINSNLRLVVKFARRYQGHGLALQDLVQEAMLGLIRATEKFDWRRGYKFSTYAVLWIKQAIQRRLDEVSAVRDLTRVTTSLDAPVGEGETSLGELRAETTVAVEDEVAEREQEEAVNAALA